MPIAVPLPSLDSCGPSPSPGTSAQHPPTWLPALHRLTDRVSRSDALASIFDEALECLASALAAPRASILLFDPGGVMRFKAWRGLSDAYRAAVDGHSPWSPTTTDASPILVPDVTVDPQLTELLPVFQREGIRALALVPLRYGDRLLGKFMIYHAEPHAFSSDEVELARIVANHVAFAVESKRTALTMLRAQEELETIFSGLQDGVIASDPSGRLLYANAVAARLCGYDSVAELLRTNFFDIGPRFEIRDEHGRLLGLEELPGARARREGREIAATLSWRSAGGEPRLSSVRAVPVFTDASARSSDLRFVVSFFRDITDERRAQQAEQAAREQAERAAERAQRLMAVTAAISRAVSPQAVIDAVLEHGVPATGADAGVVSLPSEADAVLEVRGSRGYALEDITPFLRLDAGSPFPTVRAYAEGVTSWLCSPAEVERAFPALIAPMANAGYSSLAVLPLWAHGSPIGAISFGFHEPQRFDEAQRAILLTVASFCAQALERARLYEIEHLARLEAERARRRVETLATGAKVFAEASADIRALLAEIARVVTDTLGDACVVRLLAEPDDELHPVAVHHRDPDRLEEARALSLALPRQLQGPAQLRVIQERRPLLVPRITPTALADGLPPELCERLSAMRLHSAVIAPLAVKGPVLGTISCARVGDSAPYSSEDAALLEDLAERAALALDNARLLDGTQRAVSIRDEFLSIAGHELKTPLTVIRLQVGVLSNLAAKHGLEPAVVRKVERIGRNVDRLSGLVGELLDVSRLRAGKLELVLEDVDLSAIVNDNVQRLADDLDHASCELRSDAEAPVVGRWDRSRVEQAVVNLLSNAIKYGKGCPIEVTVAVDADAEVARLEVRDHGIGIAPEDQARIFERFERAVSTRHFGGLGLGLWITRQAIEAHGGRIEVDSQVGEGACFRVLLPLGGPSEGPLGAPSKDET